MKRLFFPVTLILLLSLLLAACGGNGGIQPLPGSEQLSRLLVDAGVFSDELEPVDADIAAYLYGLTETEGVELHSWLSSSGGTAEEFSLFICQDDAALKAARESVNARLEFQKRTYGDYAPAEVPKLEGAVIRVRDKVLALCVSADSEKAAKLLAAYFPA